jgi:hypothetical protein
MWRVGERECRDGFRPPLRFPLPAGRNNGGDWGPGRVPQRGGIDGNWIDVRPRRRKALRQDYQGQDRFQEDEERFRVKDDFKLRQSRVRYASRWERWDFDTGSDFSDGRPLRWGDRDFDEETYDDYSDRSLRYNKREQKQSHAQRRTEQRDQKQSAQASVIHQKLSDVAPEGKSKAAESTLKRFVTLYITDFPPQATYFILRKGFEVCGILEYVFVANNRNRNGEVYGFVRYIVLIK